MSSSATPMKWAVILKDGDGWFLFKVFNDDGKAIRSYTSFKKQGFDVILVAVLNNEDFLSVHRLLELSRSVAH